MTQFEMGRCYFMLSFFDNEGRMPLVETYVFIGVNLMERDQQSSGRRGITRSLIATSSPVLAWKKRTLKTAFALVRTRSS